MDYAEKLKLLGGGARYDVSAPSTLFAREPLPDGSGAIYDALGPDGRPMRILKVLLSNACSYDCLFCPLRCSRELPRASFRPDELANLVAELRQADLIDGFMLSSGIVGDVDSTMERMIETVRLVRHQHGFRGHVHLKLMPGATEAAITSAAQVADHLSLNVEAPSQEQVLQICPAKDFSRHLMRPLRQAVGLIAPGRLPAGVTTQFVVGAAGETDRQILDLTWQLLAQMGLRRVYFSAFEPVEDTPMSDAEGTAHVREQRLYQAELLLRAYGFEPAEIICDDAGMLPAEIDPKLASALARSDEFPVEVNSAERWELLRVPGMGPTCVENILLARRQTRLTSLRQLTALGVRVDRARNFITVGGRAYPG
ncbi:MAG: radical SAM protein, partial [Armatimonadetes bacterium]|nr:radical SAM protein [Armatimonadota bacterium]